MIEIDTCQIRILRLSEVEKCHSKSADGKAKIHGDRKVLDRYMCQ